MARCLAVVVAVWFLSLEVAVTAQQADLRVPSQYPDIQAAINAAAPGDRILVEAGAQAVVGQAGIGSLVINKSLTIESSTPGTKRSISITGNSGLNIDGVITVTSLSPGIPLILRDLDVYFCDGMVSGVINLGFRASVTGEIRMDNVSMTIVYFDPHSETAAVIGSTRVWLKNCRFEGRSAGNNAPCADPTQWHDGGSALEVAADLLIMENCTCRGGDASVMRFVSWCNPPQDYGDGGFALRASTKTSVLTRCIFEDGNGSWFDPNTAWRNLPSPRAGRSSFISTTGELLGYDVLHIEGLDGKEGIPVGNGPINQIGEILAPLTVTGSGRLGSQIDLRVGLFAHGSAFVVLALDWGPSPTPFGPLSLDVTKITEALPVTSIGTVVQFNIPTNTSLINATLISQLVHITNGQLRFSNPSGFWVSK